MKLDNAGIIWIKWEIPKFGTHKKLQEAFANVTQEQIKIYLALCETIFVTDDFFCFPEFNFC